MLRVRCGEAVAMALVVRGERAWWSWRAWNRRRGEHALTLHSARNQAARVVAESGNKPKRVLHGLRDSEYDIRVPSAAHFPERAES